MLYQIKIPYLLCFILLLFISGCASKKNYVVYYDRSGKEQKGSFDNAISTQAVHKATLRPYTIRGKAYYPTIVSVGEVFEGKASWYGDDFHGKLTSNGEVYNMYDLTAAHKTLPMNTMVKVTNLLNNKSVVVRVNDRGPFVQNRIIDMSYRGAKSLDFLDRGVVPVKVEILGFDRIISSLTSPNQEVELNNFYVQIGSFRKKQGANTYKSRYDSLDTKGYHAIVKEFQHEGKPIYRVWVGVFRSEGEAKDFIRTSDFSGSFVVGGS